MHARRILMAGSALALVGGGLVGGITPASAATITVTTTDDELNVDGDCSLREAVQAANTDASSDACAAGTGADVITLPAGTFAPAATLVLSDADGVTIAGSGASSTTITGSDDHRVLDVADGALAVEGITLSDGDAGPDLADTGGAIRSDDDSVAITDSVVADNHASHGGGIATGAGAVTIVDSVVTGNLARWNDLNGNGGGVNTGGGAVTVTRSTFVGNTAMNAAGGIGGGGDITAEASTFTGNSAKFGAAMYSSFDVTTLTNSTVHGNTITGDDGGPGYGGAIQSSSVDAEFHLVHVTVTGTVGGSGLSNAPIMELTNTVLAENAEGNCFTFNSVTSNGGNVDDDDSCSLDDPTDLTGDPELGALVQNGGSTATRLPADGSPVIDSAVSSGCEAADQRGVSRPQDGDDDGTATCDRGAVEVQGAAPVDPTDPTTPGSPSARPVQAAPTFTG